MLLIHQFLLILFSLLLNFIAEKRHDDGCLVCGSGDHFEEDCPCFDKIPPGVELDRDYDRVCIGCGRIGEICCSKGAYATLRRCGACGWGGHWYWDDKCSKDFVHHPDRVKLSFFKDLLSAEQSSLQNKEEDQVMVDLRKDNKNEDDYGTEEYGPEVAGGNESSDQSRFKGCKAISELEQGAMQVGETLPR
uniref:uncharacterized protein LOC105353187 isoform X2 n=1 Tax=Fragaria vesca subsp. vesca TaxID=101020 RepID=UPI0005C85861|nr:PREDICTED: uncharacterized protein LOC105353187 isoform X2 [Fragaria vesca subsp. vesca]